MKNLFPWMLTIALLATFTASAAHAGEGRFEFHGGVFSATGSSDSSSFSYGARGGYRFNERWALEGSVSRAELFEIEIFTFDVDASVTTFEVSVQRFLNPGKKAEVYLVAGPGRTTYDIDINGISIATYDDAFSFHFGVGTQIALGEKVYLRPDLRARWLDQPGADVGLEASIAVGWRFGGGR